MYVNFVKEKWYLYAEMSNLSDFLPVLCRLVFFVSEKLLRTFEVESLPFYCLGIHRHSSTSPVLQSLVTFISSFIIINPSSDICSRFLDSHQVNGRVIQKNNTDGKKTNKPRIKEYLFWVVFYFILFC